MHSKRNIAKNTIFLYLRMILTMTVSLYTSRVILNTLGIDDYGLYNVVGGIITMLGFLNISMTNAIQRFMSLTIKNNQNINEVYSASLYMQFILAAIIFIIAETLGLWFICNYLTVPENRINAVLWVYHFSILQTCVLIVSVPYNAIIISYEKMKAFTYIGVLEALFKLLIAFMLISATTDKLSLYAALMFTVQLCIRIIYSAYCKQAFSNIHIVKTNIMPKLKEMLKFTSWESLSSFADVFQNNGMNLLLNIFFGPTVNAARGIALQVQGVIRNFSVNFLIAANPPITKSYAIGDREELNDLVNIVARIAFLMFYIIMLPLFIFTEEIFKFWLGSYPTYSIGFTRIIFCSTMVAMMSDPLRTAIRATGKIKMNQILLSTTMILSLFFSYILLSQGIHPNSIFICHFISMVIMFITNLLQAKQLVQMSISRFLKDVVLRCFFTVCITYPISVVIYEIVPNTSQLLSWLSAILLIGSISLITIYFVGISKKERKFIKQKILKR